MDDPKINGYITALNKWRRERSDKIEERKNSSNYMLLFALGGIFLLSYSIAGASYYMSRPGNQQQQLPQLQEPLLIQGGATSAPAYPEETRIPRSREYLKEERRGARARAKEEQIRKLKEKGKTLKYDEKGAYYSDSDY